MLVVNDYTQEENETYEINTSEYFEGEGSIALIPRRPLERCRTLLERKARSASSRSSSQKRKLTDRPQMDGQGPSPKKQTRFDFMGKK